MPITNQNRYNINPLGTIKNAAYTAGNIAATAERLGTQIPGFLNSAMSGMQQTTSGIYEKSPGFVGPPKPGDFNNNSLEKSVSEKMKQWKSNTTQQYNIASGGGGVYDILASTGKKKADPKTELKYSVIVQFEGNDQNFYDDVLVLVVYRMGIVKFATVYTLKINLTPVVLQKIKNDINDNKFPKLKMWIYTLQTVDGKQIKSPIFEKKFLISKITAKTNEILERGTQVMCELTIINPILHEMNIKYTYNKIISAKTPYEALQDYEKYLTSTYGDDFISKHILNEQNTFKYEQILTQPSNQNIELPNNKKISMLCRGDITVPQFLQYKYKIDNAFGFYFFDDFNVREKKQIVRYFITLYDKNKLEKMNTANYDDIIKKTQFNKSHKFNDFNKIIDKDNPVLNFKLPNSKFETKKTQTGSVMKSSTTSKNKVQIADDENRYYYEQKTDESKKQVSPSTDYMHIQVPDTKEGAEKRVEIIKKTVKEKVDRIDEYTTHGCSPDWLQFGFLYSLNPENPEDYTYTPTAIINIFHRVDGKDNVLEHYSRYSMIKFKEKESPPPAPENAAAGTPSDKKQATTPTSKQPDKPKLGPDSNSPNKLTKAQQEAMLKAPGFKLPTESKPILTVDEYNKIFKK